MKGIRHTLHRQFGWHPGQALVEMTLSITFVLLLLAAAVDLGLAFKTYQTLVNATAEASTYLQHFPIANCAAATTCSVGGEIEEANRIARQRFQFEQGATLRGVGSTLDLNANGISDIEEGLNSSEWVRITEADDTQVSNMATYDPNLTAPECLARNPKPTGVSACYIVVRAEIIYRPFFLVPIVGNQMTIRTTSVRQIVSP